ncbi:MAG TPA: TonB-dependent receptor plug domain-containing protein [Longimicrobium sp.]
MTLKRLTCRAGLVLLPLAAAACADRMTAADSKPRPSSIAELLQARVSSVQVREQAKGSGARIRICNYVQMVPEHPPLYVVNGRKVSHNDIHAMAIDPAKIENMEIIKGPSATERYGIEAVNGVVLITLRP